MCVEGVFRREPDFDLTQDMNARQPRPSADYSIQILSRKKPNWKVNLRNQANDLQCYCPDRAIYLPLAIRLSCWAMYPLIKAEIPHVNNFFANVILWSTKPNYKKVFVSNIMKFTPWSGDLSSVVQSNQIPEVENPGSDSKNSPQYFHTVPN